MIFRNSRFFESGDVIWGRKIYLIDVVSEFEVVVVGSSLVSRSFFIR